MLIETFFLYFEIDNAGLKWDKQCDFFLYWLTNVLSTLREMGDQFVFIVQRSRKQ